MNEIIVEDDVINQMEEYNIVTTPPQKIIGIIGINQMSSQLVKKLIQTGHTVNIWSRSRPKCNLLHNQLDDAFKGKLKTYLSPRGVLKNSDIMLNFVSDHEAAKRIIRIEFGINNDSDNVLQGKGFVEMASIDPGGSIEMKNMVENKGGKYLEAQIQIGRLEGVKGKLLVLTSGNKLLYDECHSCFDAMESDALYYGEVGYATTINLILQQMKGVFLVGLTEGLALAERCGIECEDFIKILNSTTDISSSYLVNNVTTISNKDFTNVQQPLKSMRNDLNSTLDLSKNVGQPMYVTATATEIFKYCQTYGYGDHDVSTVHQFHR